MESWNCESCTRLHHLSFSVYVWAWHSTKSDALDVLHISLQESLVSVLCFCAFPSVCLWRSHERGSNMNLLLAMRVEVVCASMCPWRPDDGNFRIHTLSGAKSSKFSCRCLAPWQPSLFQSPWTSAVSLVPHVMSYVLKQASCVCLSGIVNIQEIHASPSLVHFLSTTGPVTLQSQISV